MLKVSKILNAAILDDDQVFAILEEAELNGMHGACGAAAIAINRTIFNGTGAYLVAYNGPIYEKTGRFFGHVAVKAPNGTLWDAEGETDQETIESWGMLAPDDPDYSEMYGPGWDEEKAYTVVFREVDDDFIDGLLDTSQDTQMMRHLRDAMEGIAKATAAPPIAPGAQGHFSSNSSYEDKKAWFEGWSGPESVNPIWEETDNKLLLKDKLPQYAYHGTSLESAQLILRGGMRKFGQFSTNLSYCKTFVSDSDGPQAILSIKLRDLDKDKMDLNQDASDLDGFIYAGTIKGSTFTLVAVAEDKP